MAFFFTEGAYEPCGAYALASVPKLQFRQEQEVEEVEEVYSEVNPNKAPVPVSYFSHYFITAHIALFFSLAEILFKNFFPNLTIPERTCFTNLKILHEGLLEDAVTKSDC